MREQKNLKASKLGTFLRRQREKMELSLEDVAKQSPITASTIAGIETGDIETPSKPVLRAFAKVYDVSVERLNGMLGADAMPSDTVAKMGMDGDMMRRRHSPELEDKDDDEMDTPTMGATSFAQIREAERAQDAARSVRKLANQVPGLVEGIFQDPAIEDKDAAIADLGPEFSALVLEGMNEAKERWQPLTDAVIKALSPLLEKVKPTKEATATVDDATPTNSFMLYKEADGGYRWLAIYSNKFRDRDNPPEIISEASHLNFVKEVNSGALPYPELWLWHVKGSRWGVADFVGYDDNGFAVASGTVDKGKEWIADTLMGFEGELLTSHGMPTNGVERDAHDKTIITRHITKEISPLPANVAANEHTGFNILGEVTQMALTDQDKAKLTALGVDPDRLEAETESKAVETDGLEFKEADKPEESAQGEFVSRDEVAELVKSVAQSTNQLVEVVGTLAKRIETLEANKLTVDKDTIERTPAASLAELHKSIIGATETKVDGRSSIAKSGPQETEPGTGSAYGDALAELIAKRNQEIERGGVQ